MPIPVDKSLTIISNDLAKRENMELELCRNVITVLWAKRRREHRLSTEEFDALQLAYKYEGLLAITASNRQLARLRAKATKLRAESRALHGKEPD
jgi:hypothetical protein